MEQVESQEQDGYGLGNGSESNMEANDMTSENEEDRREVLNDWTDNPEILKRSRRYLIESRK